MPYKPKKIKFKTQKSKTKSKSKTKNKSFNKSFKKASNMKSKFITPRR